MDKRLTEQLVGHFPEHEYAADLAARGGKSGTQAILPGQPLMLSKVRREHTRMMVYGCMYHPRQIVYRENTCNIIIVLFDSPFAAFTRYTCGITRTENPCHSDNGKLNLKRGAILMPGNSIAPSEM